MACNFCSNSFCNNGGICQVSNTSGLNCNAWGNSNCIQNNWNQCGCQFLQPSDCVFYSGVTTPCLGIRTNTNLTDIIKIFDKVACTSINPSGISSSCTEINGTPNQIISVATLQPSGCSSYQIGISPIVLNSISTNTTNIATLSGQISNLVSSVITNTPNFLSISGPTAGIVTINYIPPSGASSGIIWSDYTNSTTTNTSFQTIKSYSIGATQLSTNGDKIVTQIRFISTNSSSGIPLVRIQFNGVTIVQNFPFFTNNVNMYEFELWIVRLSNTSVDLILKINTGTDTGTLYKCVSSDGYSYVINMSGLNLTTTSYSIDCDAMSVIAGDITCNFLEVEYKKRI